MIVKEEFIKYLMKLDLYPQYIGDISKCTNFINILEDEYQQAFHSNPFDVTDLPTNIQLISSNLKLKDNSFALYSQKTGSGVPKAIMNKHFIHFLKTIHNEDKYELPIIQKDIKRNKMKELSILKQKKQIILQGAPGTGKTYKTAELAVALCDDVDTASMNREDIMERYRELCMEGRIGFTTFHQSMDYEEFVEGIKPIINLDKQTEYIINKGIFKSISQKALLENIKLTPNSYTELEFEDNYDLLISAIKTGGITEFQQKSTSTPIEVINISKNRNIIFRHKGCNKQYIISKERLTKLYDHYKTSEAFYRIKNINNEFRDIIGGCNCSGYWAILNYLFSHNSSVQPIDIDIKNLKEEEQENLIQRFISDMKKDRVERTNKQAKPYLLIIDEINRGNISKIFGELITLLEADKRTGGNAI